MPWDCPCKTDALLLRYAYALIRCFLCICEGAIWGAESESCLLVDTGCGGCTPWSMCDISISLKVVALLVHMEQESLQQESCSVRLPVPMLEMLKGAQGMQHHRGAGLTPCIPICPFDVHNEHLTRARDAHLTRKLFICI